MGFPVSQNQFQILSEIEVQEPELSKEQNLEDPRKTRAQRLQASSRAEGQETLQRNDAVNYSPPVVENETTFFNSLSVTPVEILHSHSAGNFELEIGDFSDAVYENAVKDVACTKDYCNKRISDAGPERSVGRPGHTPTRRELVCEKNIEDRVGGQDWSGGRLGTRPFGASIAACSSSIMACLGPYGTAHEQPHHMGLNPREEKFTASSAS